MEIHEDDLLFCKVKGVEGASVFLEIEGEKRQGTMTLSEVAAGRIRNLREYVSPGRKGVCKVLRIMPDHIELSLRRVTAKEREQVLDAYKKERAFISVLKVVGENAEKVAEEIKKEFDIIDFLEQARADVKVLERFVSKENAKKILQIIAEKESKETKVIRKFVLKSDSEKGISEIKEILEVNDATIHYLGSSIFSIEVFSRDFKEANSMLDKILVEIEKKAKVKKAIFEIKQK